MTESPSTPAPLLIRADASELIGTGHVMRMLALAQAYRHRGGRVIFASATCPEALRNRLRTEGIECPLFADTVPGDEADREATRELAKARGAVWVVLDGYHFGYDFQKNLRRSGLRLLVLDDHGFSRDWSADAILNQNLYAPTWTYPSAGGGGAALLGTRFALLRREFRPMPDPAQCQPGASGPVERLLITLGGADPENVSGQLLELLEPLDTVEPLEIRLIAGASNRHLEALEDAASKAKADVTVLTHISDMPAQYRWADAVITAGGSTCWEWLRYSLPACVVGIADNQLPIVDALVSQGFARRLELDTSEKRSAARHTVRSFLQDPSRGIRRPGPEGAVDARGAERVAAFLHGHLKIVIATAAGGWFEPFARQLASEFGKMGHSARLAHRAADVGSGDILLLLSCWELVPAQALERFTHALVVHESDLPQGRGWSPLTWQILDGAARIPVTLFEAEADIDSGPIYRQEFLEFEGHELLPEIHRALGELTSRLGREFVAAYPRSTAHRWAQSGEPSFYRRRTAEDSRLDPEKSLASQFPLLRVVDNSAYPAYFTHRGHRYRLTIEKDDRPSSGIRDEDD